MRKLSVRDAICSHIEVADVETKEESSKAEDVASWPPADSATEGNCKKPTLMSTGNKNKTSVSNYICIVFANCVFDKLTVYLR